MAKHVNMPYNIPNAHINKDKCLCFLLCSGRLKMNIMNEWGMIAFGTSLSYFVLGVSTLVIIQLKAWGECEERHYSFPLCASHISMMIIAHFQSHSQNIQHCFGSQWKWAQNKKHKNLLSFGLMFILLALATGRFRWHMSCLGTNINLDIIITLILLKEVKLYISLDSR